MKNVLAISILIISVYVLLINSIYKYAEKSFTNYEVVFSIDNLKNK